MYIIWSFSLVILLQIVVVFFSFLPYSVTRDTLIRVYIEHDHTRHIGRCGSSSCPKVSSLFIFYNYSAYIMSKEPHRKLHYHLHESTCMHGPDLLTEAIVCPNHRKWSISNWECWSQVMNYCEMVIIIYYSSCVTTKVAQMRFICFW